MKLVDRMVAAARRSRTVRKLDSLLAAPRKARMSTPAERDRLLDWLTRTYGVDARALSAEYRDSKFRRWYQDALKELERSVGLSGTSSDFDCETLYLLVRAAGPESVVETGVLYGAVSAHILAALEANGRGRLHSVDLEDLTPLTEKSRLVPPELHGRWELRIGDSRIQLPRLLAELGSIDLFYHDSLHTYDHMRWEYGTALPHLQSSGLLCSHDVIGSRWFPNAFEDFVAGHELASLTFRNVGVAWRPNAERS